MGDLLQICQVAVKQSAADGEEVRVSRVLDLHKTPRVLSRSDLLTTDLQDILGTDNGERHQSPQLRVLFHSVLVVLFNVVREVVDGDAVVLNVLHHQLLRLGQLSRGEGIGLSNDGDNVDAGREALHQFDIQFAQTVAGRGDEIEQGVHSVVPETGVTLDS